MPVALAWQLEEKAAGFTDDLRGRYRRVARRFPGLGQADHRDLPEAIRAFRAEVGITDTRSRPAGSGARTSRPGRGRPSLTPATP